MNHLWLSLTIGILVSAILMHILACDEARPQDKPPIATQSEPIKPKEPDHQIADLFTKLDALRIGQIMTLINQLCTEENGINEECGAVVSKCFAEKWAPVNKLRQCHREWKESKP